MRYHPIVDPQTGWPADSRLLSVTLFGDSAMELDAPATGIYVLILTEQTTDVSTVSGATFSSSIMEAVADALGSSVGSLGQSVDESNSADSSVETKAISIGNVVYDVVDGYTSLVEKVMK